MIKPTTRMYFDATGVFEYKFNDYKPEETSKKNPSYKFARLTSYLRVNDQRHIINLMGGFSPTTKFYTFDSDGGSKIVNFSDRFDEKVIGDIPINNFRTIDFKTEDKEQVKFLSDFDFIRSIPEHIKSGALVRMRGEVTFSEYQGEVQKNFNVKNIIVLQEPDYTNTVSDYAHNFKLNFNTLLNKHSFNAKDIVENEDGTLEVKLTTFFYVKKSADKKEVYDYPIYFKCKSKNPEQTKKDFEKYFGTDKVVKIGFVGNLFNGKIMKEVDTVDEINAKLEEMKNSGVVSEEYCHQEEERAKFNSVSYVEKIYATSIKYNIETGSLEIDDQMYTEEDLVWEKPVEPVIKPSATPSATPNVFVGDDDDDTLPF